MTKRSDDARDRAVKAMNEAWHRVASKMIAQANTIAGGTAGGDVVTKSMLTVAIGYELQTIGFRQISLDLYEIGKNFAKIADQIDDLDDIERHFAETGGYPTTKTH